jgi:hypothetical protein
MITQSYQEFRDMAREREFTGKLREKIRERADHFYDVTLPWIKMMKFIHETT